MKIPDAKYISNPANRKFDELSDKIDVIREIVEIKSSRDILELLKEMRDRFEQLSFIFARIAYYEEIMKDASAKIHSNEISTFEQEYGKLYWILADARLNLETFYLVAQRTIDIKRKINTMLSKSAKTAFAREPVGIIFVRNELLVHQRKVLGRAFGLDLNSGAGFFLNTSRSPGQEHIRQDVGFHKNALEFIEFWENWFEGLKKDLLR